MKLASTVACISFLALGLSSACSSTGAPTPPPQEEEESVEIGPNTYKRKIVYQGSAPPSLQMNVAPGLCWTAQHYDAAGNELPSTSGSGQGFAVVPENARLTVITVAPCPPPPPLGLPGSGSGGTSVQGVAKLRAAKDFVISVSDTPTDLELLTGDVLRRATFVVSALASPGATQTALNVTTAGSSQSVPQAVTVLGFVEAWVSLTDLHLRALHPATMEQFRVLIDGVLVADLATGLNVTAAVSPAGWYEVSATAPFSVINTGTVVEVHEKALGLDEVVHTIQF